MLKEKIIESLGIDLDNFISPSEFVREYELPNLKEATEIFLSHMENGSRVSILQDA